MTTIDFWYEFASTYSYPAAMQIERRARIEGVTLRWRPFLLGPIFSSHGWNDSPFNLYPAKGRYMWRDLERICAKESLPLKLPPLRFPQNGLKAARIALVLAKNGRINDFSRRVYTASFAEQKVLAAARIRKKMAEDAMRPPRWDKMKGAPTGPLTSRDDEGVNESRQAAL